MNYREYWQYPDKRQSKLLAYEADEFIFLQDGVQSLLERFPVLDGNLTILQRERLHRDIQKHKDEDYYDSYMLMVYLAGLKRRMHIKRNTAFKILLTALFMEYYAAIFKRAKEINADIAADKYRQFTGEKQIEPLSENIYTKPLPTGISPKDMIETEAVYRAERLSNILTAKKLDDKSFNDISGNDIQTEFRKAKNALLRASDGGGYHGILDEIMTNIVGYTVMEAAKDIGAKTYTFHAVIDDRTTPACRTLNGRTFKVSEMRLGYNVPPIAFYLDSGAYIPHPCRSWVSFGNELTNDANRSIIYSGAISGALNPNSDEALEHSEKYYELVRKMKTDVNNIARNTNYSIEDIKKVKNYIFFERHNLGDGRIDRFDADYMMAQSWQRLIDGKNIKNHDYTLIKHELLEREYKLQGIPHDKAHSLATKKYNYSEEAEKYYAEINKYKEK